MGTVVRWALHWSVYLQTHARRCYGITQSGEADTVRWILERIGKGAIKPAFHNRFAPLK